MRAASYLAGTIMAISVYLLIAATVALAPAWIAAGAIGIALVAAIAFVARTGGAELA